VLESPSVGLAEPIVRARRRDDDDGWARLLDEEGIVAFVDAWEAQPVFASEARLPPDVRERRRTERLAQDPRALAAALRGAGQAAMEPLQDRLTSIGIPTQLIAGIADPVGLDRARDIARRMPGARLEIVSDAGHAPHIERPEAFIELLLAFLGAPQPISAS
jgi:pimeloyl-ACP methyl ester carboxylesterase